MVLQLKLRKSRSSPGFVAGAEARVRPIYSFKKSRCRVTPSGGFFDLLACGPVRVKRAGVAGQSVDAGWSSPVARQAHNLKVVGSNPTPATNRIRVLAETG